MIQLNVGRKKMCRLFDKNFKGADIFPHSIPEKMAGNNQWQ
jgi:hypothetical protein